MLSQSQIVSISDDAAYRAAQEGKTPLVPWKAEDVTHAPFLGDYVPAGWRQAEWSDLPVRGEAPDWGWPEHMGAAVCVDSFGFDGGPAMSPARFGQFVMDLMADTNDTLGIAIRQAGQFQVYIGIYVKDEAARGVAAGEPDGWCDSCQSSFECYCDDEPDFGEDSMDGACLCHDEFVCPDEQDFGFAEEEEYPW